MFCCLENLINHLEKSVSNILNASLGLPLPVLVLLAFGGGLAASLTPCVLPMIPLYLSYMGATQITSRIDAIKKSLLFCLGSALVFTFMGIFASFASFIMVEFRGYVSIAVGIFIFLMSLFLLEVIKLPLPQFIKNIPEGSPFIVGLAFALVSSPCASPILFAVLAMSSTVKSFLGGSLIMFAYSAGYTAIIFIAGIFAGFLKRLDFFKKHSRIVITVSVVILTMLSIFYIYSGIKWFLG